MVENASSEVREILESQPMSLSYFYDCGKSVKLLVSNQ